MKFPPFVNLCMIAVCFAAGCRNNDHEAPMGNTGIAATKLIDSVYKLEKLSNSNRIINKEISKTYAFRALALARQN